MNNINRALGAFENFFWLIGQDRPIQAILAADVEGSASVDEWRSALDAVQQRHPLFSVCIDGGKDVITRFRYVENVRVPMRVITGGIENLNDELSRELSDPFDDQQAPLIRTLLIQGDNRSIFVIVRHHSIGDGISLTYVFRDLLNALNGQTLAPLPAPASVDDLLGLTKNTPYDPELLPQTTSVATTVHQRSEKKTASIKRVKLTVDETSNIINRSRLEQTTVYGALCAAFVLAGRQISGGWEEKPVRVLTPASTREVLNSGEGSCLSMNCRIVPFDQNPGLSFWDIARFSKESLQGITSKEDILNATIGQRGLVFNGLDVNGAITALNTILAHELLLTNIGRISFDTDFGKLKLRDIWGPFHLSGLEGEQYIGAVTTNGSLCLSVTSNDPLERLLDVAVEILKSECAL